VNCHTRHTTVIYHKLVRVLATLSRLAVSDTGHTARKLHKLDQPAVHLHKHNYFYGTTPHHHTTFPILLFLPVFLGIYQFSPSLATFASFPATCTPAGHCGPCILPGIIHLCLFCAGCAYCVVVASATGMDHFQPTCLHVGPWDDHAQRHYFGRIPMPVVFAVTPPLPGRLHQLAFLASISLRLPFRRCARRGYPTGRRCRAFIIITCNIVQVDSCMHFLCISSPSNICVPCLRLFWAGYFGLFRYAVPAGSDVPHRAPHGSVPRRLFIYAARAYPYKRPDYHGTFPFPFTDICDAACLRLFHNLVRQFCPTAYHRPRMNWYPLYRGATGRPVFCLQH